MEGVASTLLMERLGLGSMFKKLAFLVESPIRGESKKFKKFIFRKGEGRFELYIEKYFDNPSFMAVSF